MDSRVADAHHYPRSGRGEDCSGVVEFGFGVEVDVIVSCGQAEGRPVVAVVKGDPRLDYLDGFTGVGFDFFVICDDVGEDNPLDVLNLFEIHDPIIVPVCVFQATDKVTSVGIRGEEIADLVEGALAGENVDLNRVSGRRENRISFLHDPAVVFWELRAIPVLAVIRNEQRQLLRTSTLDSSDDKSMHTAHPNEPTDLL